MPGCNMEMIVFILKDLDVVVCTIYRTQQYSIPAFITQLGNIVGTLEMQSSKIVVVGDFNQDIFKGDTTILYHMNRHGYKQFPLTQLKVEP